MTQDGMYPTHADGNGMSEINFSWTYNCRLWCHQFYFRPFRSTLQEQAFSVARVCFEKAQRPFFSPEKSVFRLFLNILTKRNSYRNILFLSWCGTGLKKMLPCIRIRRTWSQQWWLALIDRRMRDIPLIQIKGENKMLEMPWNKHCRNTTNSSLFYKSFLLSKDFVSISRLQKRLSTTKMLPVISFR